MKEKNNIILDRINVLIKRVELLQSNGSYDVTVPLQIEDRKYQCDLRSLYMLKEQHKIIDKKLAS